MVFACQRDSFLKEFKTKVVSCKEGKLGKQTGFEIILEDTILFPEGGGQVFDLNWDSRLTSILVSAAVFVINLLIVDVPHDDFISTRTSWNNQAG